MTIRRLIGRALAGSALFAAAPVFAQSPDGPAQGVIELLEKAFEAKGSGDHAGALDAYNKAAALLADDPSQQDGLGLVLQADLQRDIARATFAAGASDPCPVLDRGMTYLEQGRMAFSGPSDVGTAEIVDDIEQQLNNELSRMGCARSGTVANSRPESGQTIGTPDASLVGNYYLSGVMETGSELRLRSDGRFDWFISYGAVDQVAHGRWGRTGQTVLLSADLPPADAPLFRVDQSFAWDEAVERRLRETERSNKADAIADLCPWNIAVAQAPPLLLPEDRPSPGPAEQAKAAEAERAAKIARDEASRAAAKAVAADASEADRTAAYAAMSAWYAAHYEMDQAYRVAGMPEPDVGSPVVPPECQLAPDDTAAEFAPSQWRRGIAVVVGDPARETRLSRVGVTFVFSDSHRETTKTSRGGWAFAPLRQGAVVEQLIIAMPEPVSRSATLPIPPLADGVQTVIVDTQQLVPPPFEIMRLEVNGEDLIPENMGRGRYSRN